MVLGAADDDAVITMVVVVTVVVLIGWGIFKLAMRTTAKPKSEPMYCPSCGTYGWPKSKYQGSDALSIALFLLIFPACVLYELWRHTAPKWVCPACGNGGMLPANTPAAGCFPRAVLPLPATLDRSDLVGPGRFCVCGVDRETRMDTTWYCQAENEANARVKGELEGIVVTSVERT